MPLLKRSYEKQENMLGGKNFVCRNLYGEYLEKNPYGQGYDMEKAMRGLSPDGKRMITSFIEQNKEREKVYSKKEQLLYEEAHNTKKSKKDIKPFWKNGLHVIKYFGPPLIDKCYKFKAPPIPKYEINQPPFRRPKAEGDYIDKNIYPLGPSETEY